MRLFQLATRFDAHAHSVRPFVVEAVSVLSVCRFSLPMLLGLLICSGCANIREKRTITAFQSGLEADNLELLRENSTRHFASKALRHPQADDALAQLKLPEGEFKILNVEDVSETEKKVTVGFGKEKKRKIMYRLVKEGEKEKWKVDDIYLRQRKGKKVVVMPITEQMDVLLSAREFFDSWSEGDRQRVLASCSPELREALEKLPPSVLAYNISLIVGKVQRTRSFRPEAHIRKDKAVVKLNRPHGTIQFSIEKNGSGWQVSDLALVGNDKESRIDSLLQRVEIINQAMVFLEAWQKQDKSRLKQVTLDRFYTAGLAPARLSDVPLPSAFEVEGKVDVKLAEKRADVILNDQKQTIQMTLKQDQQDPEDFFVADVILYDMENQQTLSLISALTARPVAELFVEALARRDADMLQQNTTRDFHGKTWSRASKQTLAILPIPLEGLKNAHQVETEFQGEITRVRFAGGSSPFTVVLHDQGGRVLVDDVLIDQKDELERDKQESLKNYLAAIVPVYELAASIHNNQPGQTVRLVTDDFYNRVFAMTKTMPESAYTYLTYVSAGHPKLKFPELGKQTDKRKKSKKRTEEIVIEFNTTDKPQTIVTFTGNNSIMNVTLVEEDGLLRVNDALINTPNSEVAQRLKQTMRMELANRRTQRGIQLASAISKQTANRKKTGVTASGVAQDRMTKSVSPGDQTVSAANGESNQPGNPPLQNALYEQYEAARPVQQPVRQIEQTGYIEQTGHTTGSDDPGSRRSPNPLHPHGIARQQGIPRQHGIEDHLLLQPIPID